MVWWWIGNAVLVLVVIPLVAFLATRLVRRTREVRDYAADTLTHGLAITANLDPIPALAQTRDLVRSARDLAGRYAAAAARLLEGRL